MKKNLEIILRTCDKRDVHQDWRKRYCGLPKNQIIEGCLHSLIKSCEKIEGLHLVVLDDHSSQQTVDNIKTQLENSLLDYEFISLDQEGYNFSAHQQYLRCRDSQYNLVYSVEDDYLHCKTAIQEMIDSYNIFQEKLNKPIVLFPFDEPDEYRPPSRQDFIVHGSNRHWRTGIASTQVLFTSPALFKNYWSLFETLALKYNGNYLEPRTEHYEESNTIYKIWTSGNAIRFNPIPSLALHLQFDRSCWKI